MEGVTIAALIASLTAVLGLIVLISRVVTPMQERAKQDGIREQRMAEIEKDVSALEGKVDNLQADHTKVSDKVIGLESKVLTKLDGIETLLKTHINNHTGGA